MVERVYAALCAQDYDLIESYLHDDVQWTIGGPVDALPFCGTYRGKKNVRHLLEHKIGETLGRRKIVADIFVVDGHCGALLGRLMATPPSGLPISYRIAQFFALRDGKVVEHTSVLDSFDAVQQVTGRQISIAPAAGSGLPPSEIDAELFAV